MQAIVQMCILLVLPLVGVWFVLKRMGVFKGMHEGFWEAAWASVFHRLFGHSPRPGQVGKKGRLGCIVVLSAMTIVATGMSTVAVLLMMR